MLNRLGGQAATKVDCAPESGHATTRRRRVVSGMPRIPGSAVGARPVGRRPPGMKPSYRLPLFRNPALKTSPSPFTLYFLNGFGGAGSSSTPSRSTNRLTPSVLASISRTIRLGLAALDSIALRYCWLICDRPLRSRCVSPCSRRIRARLRPTSARELIGQGSAAGAGLFPRPFPRAGRN